MIRECLVAMLGPNVRSDDEVCSQSWGFEIQRRFWTIKQLKNNKSATEDGVIYSRRDPRSSKCNRAHGILFDNRARILLKWDFDTDCRSCSMIRSPT